MAGAGISMASLESTIEKAVVRWVYENLGIQGLKLKMDGKRGFPDRTWFLPGGQIFMIEFKRPGGKLSASQRVVIEWLTGAGFKVEVHDDKFNAITAILDAVETTRLPNGGKEILARARERSLILRPRPR